MHDACVALMHLARFKMVRKALLNLNVVPLLADMAEVSMMLQAEQAVCGLLRLLVKVDGGAEALCLRDGGRGALALQHFALEGFDTTKEIALDTLLYIADRKPECAAALNGLGVPQKLASSDAFSDCSADIRKKVSPGYSLAGGGATVTL